jgi:hypothetical protein
MSGWVVVWAVIVGFCAAANAWVPFVVAAGLLIYTAASNKKGAS